MNVIITMAGRGERFRAEGYNQPKYRIEARGRTLFEWAVESLRGFFDIQGRFIFLPRAEDDSRRFIENAARRLGIERFAIVETEGDTPGQAATASLASKEIGSPDDSICIYNIDTRVTPGILSPDSFRGDGWIPCFPGPGEHWSFARADRTGLVLEVREKNRISDDATVGLYGFSSFRLFEAARESYYSDPTNLDHREQYIAPIYNELIAHGRSVYIERLPADAVCALGTPEEVLAFDRDILRDYR